MNKSRWIVLLAIVLAFVSAPVFAQGNSSASSLTGTVVDKDGGVVPGVSVVVKSDATGVSQNTTTNSQGIYNFPTIDPGMYTVTITLQGFKTVTVKEVRLLAGVPGNVGKTTLEIGALSETVEVKGGTDLVRTQSPTVSSTVSTEFISSLPRGDRNALSFLIFLPGVQTSGGAGNSRGSTISGLPQNTINISIDGVTTSNLLQSTDGFFSLVVPRLDSVEEVTLSTAAAGADASGMGASQVKFVTRSGTNQFNTSIYDYFQKREFNSNTFFNYNVSKLPRPRRTIQNYGGRVGGPIVIPGLFDGHGKAFFFFNQEETWSPGATARARTIAKTAAVNGDFTYTVSGVNTTVNVLTLAQGNGQLFSTDPTVMALLGKIREAASSTGNVQPNTTNPNVETFNYQVEVASRRHSPTGRVDVNLTQKHRLSGTYYWQKFSDTPDTLNSVDPSFPGFPVQAGQSSFRTTGSSTLRSTFGTNIVNEVLGGWQWSPVDFFGDANLAMFSDPRANQDGYAMNMGFGLTNAIPGFLDGQAGNGPEVRNTVNWNVDDTLNWQRGAHSLKFGYSFVRVTNYLEDTIIAPRVSFGLSTQSTTDPALTMFNNANFVGATSTDLNNARALYALLVGRISQLPGTAQLNNAGTAYEFNGPARDEERQDQHGFFAQDSWRWKPNLTISAGLRYQLQMPMVATVGRLTSSTITDVCGKSGLGAGPEGRLCNMFKPGVFGNAGFTAAGFTPLTAQTKGYNLDTNNWAPSIGANWRPMVQNGFLRKILGDPEQATVSGGFARTFNLERVDRFQSIYVGNPGTTTPATRGVTSADFALCGDVAGTTPACPLLFRNKSTLTPAPFNPTPTFPLTALSTQSVNAFDPNIRSPYTDSWTMGVQRSVSRDMAVEVRYIGNVNKDPWVRENWNGANYRETGLLGTNSVDNVANQFAAAQANLVANNNSGDPTRVGSFKYAGAGTGTTPLPLFFAHFTAGLTPGTFLAAANDSTQYTSTQFTNTTWVNALNPFNPNPQSIATNLWTGSNGQWRGNAIDNTGIYPLNFWVMNPNVTNARVMRNLGESKYNSMQVDVRRRFSQGLQAQLSYTYARGVNFNVNDQHLPLAEQRSTAIPHAVKLLWTWDLPVGRGRRFGTNWNSLMDGALGGWTFAGSGRIQVPLFRLSNTLVMGMTQSEAQKLLKQTRIEVSPTGAVTVWNMPKDVVDNTILAYSNNPASTTFYSGAAPSGRFFAPASRPAGVYTGQYSNACTGLFPGDCAPDLFFYGKWFGEYDFKLVKKFQLPGKAVFETNIEVFNALLGTNFNNSFTVPENANGTTIADTFRIRSQGSAARQAQLVFRVTF